MSREIVDDDDDFSADDFDPTIESSAPTAKDKSDARRRIEEMMELRRLKSLLDDPYRDTFDEDY
ncbi:MAG: hypothetical protein P8045_14155 [Candidatus Thiodiazotropha sp.]|jgi:hypothetical protein